MYMPHRLNKGRKYRKVAEEKHPYLRCKSLYYHAERERKKKKLHHSPDTGFVLSRFEPLTISGIVMNKGKKKCRHLKSEVLKKRHTQNVLAVYSTWQYY